MMDSKIMELLGEQNIEKLKKDICELIKDKFWEDIDSGDEYWVTAEDFVDLIDEIKAEIKLEVKQKILKKLVNDIDKLDIKDIIGEKEVED